MARKTPTFQKRHLHFIADKFGPLAPSPSQILEIADILAPTNPRFDRSRFIAAATQAWEDVHVQRMADEADDHHSMIESREVA